MFSRIVKNRAFKFCSDLMQELEEGKRKRKHERVLAESVVSV